MEIDGHIFWVRYYPPFPGNNSVRKAWIPLIKYKDPFHCVIMRRYMIGIEHYIGDVVIEYTLLDSNACIRLGYLKKGVST